MADAKHREQTMPEIIAAGLISTIKSITKGSTSFRFVADDMHMKPAVEQHLRAGSYEPIIKMHPDGGCSIVLAK